MRSSSPKLLCKATSASRTACCPPRDWSGTARADLVVLSACEAGSGAALIGSEVLGLVSALVRAGVGAVVASVWSVDDAATSYLMRTFHRLIAEGATPVHALARAQAAVRGQKGWSSPYYWAGFLIAGRRLAERGALEEMPNTVSGSLPNGLA